MDKISTDMIDKLKNKRKKSIKKFLKQFWNDCDRIALGFGWTSKRWKREKTKEWKEQIAIDGNLDTLIRCSCSKMPILAKHWNLEYPEGVYIKCECGMRTGEYVEFVLLNPTQPKQQTYSLVASIAKAVLVWNKSKEGIS